MADLVKTILTAVLSNFPLSALGLGGLVALAIARQLSQEGERL